MQRFKDYIFYELLSHGKPTCNFVKFVNVHHLYVFRQIMLMFYVNV